MTRVLTLFLVLHWAVVFSLLCAMVMVSGSGAILSGFGLIGDLTGADQLALSGMANRAAFGFGFAICALLFWWAFVTMFSSAADRSAGDDVLKTAFAVATGMMTVVLLISTLEGANGLYPAMAAHFAAMIASYIAIKSEQQSVAIHLAADDHNAAIRVRAADALNTARLSRFVTTQDGKRSFDR